MVWADRLFGYGILVLGLLSLFIVMMLAML